MRSSIFSEGAEGSDHLRLFDHPESYHQLIRNWLHLTCIMQSPANAGSRPLCYRAEFLCYISGVKRTKLFLISAGASLPAQRVFGKRYFVQSPNETIRGEITIHIKAYTIYPDLTRKRFKVSSYSSPRLFHERGGRYCMC